MQLHSIMSILLGFLELLYWTCVYYHQRNPSFSLPKIFSTPIGPRTDVVLMSRRELLESATSFLLWGIHFTIAMVISSYLIFGVFYKNSEPPMALAVIFFFAFPIACGMCYLGAAYLFIRGIFRRADYVPRGYIVIHGGLLAIDYAKDILAEYKDDIWHKAKWHKRPALLRRDGKEQQLYNGQYYDPKVFDLDPVGWEHDHCAICFWTICDQKDHEQCSAEGYTNGIDWICSECYDKLISQKFNDSCQGNV